MYAKVGIIAGAVILILTGCLLCYKGYIATGPKGCTCSRKACGKVLYNSNKLRQNW